MLKKAYVGLIVLVMDENRGNRRTEQIRCPRPDQSIKFFAPGPQQVPLEQAVADQNKDGLIDDQAEIRGIEVTSYRLSNMPCT